MITYQLGQLVAATLFGFMLGLYYDIYNLLLFWGNIKKYLRGVLDFLWWATVFSALFLFWYGFLGWEVRFSILLWMAIGFCLYMASLHFLFLRAKKRIRPRKAGQTAKEFEVRRGYLKDSLDDLSKSLYRPAQNIWQGARFAEAGFKAVIKGLNPLGHGFKKLGGALFPKRKEDPGDCPDEYTDDYSEKYSQNFFDESEQKEEEDCKE